MADPRFPVGARPPCGGEHLPTRQRFIKFVCQNERIETLVGQGRPCRVRTLVPPLLSIDACYGEKVAAQMDGGLHLWTTLMSTWAINIHNYINVLFLTQLEIRKLWHHGAGNSPFIIPLYATKLNAAISGKGIWKSFEANCKFHVQQSPSVVCGLKRFSIIFPLIKYF